MKQGMRILMIVVLLGMAHGVSSASPTPQGHAWRLTDIRDIEPEFDAAVLAAYPEYAEEEEGLVGAFAAKWLLVQGARVIVVDLEESRLARARKWGATCTACAGSLEAGTGR